MVNTHGRRSRVFPRIALLRDGRLVRTGTPEEVITTRNIRDVYQVEVLVEPHPLTGKPHVLYAR